MPVVYYALYFSRLHTHGAHLCTDSRRMQKLGRGVASGTGRRGWGRGAASLSLLVLWCCSHSHVHALLEQRNNVRKNKAKQTKVVTIQDTDNMVPCCWTPLQVFGCRNIIKSLSPCQPTGPLIH